MSVNRNGLSLEAMAVMLCEPQGGWRVGLGTLLQHSFRHGHNFWTDQVGTFCRCSHKDELSSSPRSWIHHNHLHQLILAAKTQQVLSKFLELLASGRAHYGGSSTQTPTLGLRTGNLAAHREPSSLTPFSLAPAQDQHSGSARKGWGLQKGRKGNMASQLTTHPSP